MAEKDAKEKDAKENGGEINPAWLKGLTFRGATPKEVEEDGVKKQRFIPFERPLQPGDVLAWKDKGATVTIVTNDGRKYQVKK